MKFSTITNMALTSLAIAKPIPEGDNIVPIRWNHVEASVHAAESSAVDTSAANIAVRHATGIFSDHKHKSGAEQGFRGGSGLWGRDVKYEHTHNHDQEHEHEHERKPEDHNNGFDMAAGEKSGAESDGFHGGSHLWGRAPEPEPKKHGKGKVSGDIEGAVLFDEGGDHSNDPSWG